MVDFVSVFYETAFSALNVPFRFFWFIMGRGSGRGVSDVGILRGQVCSLGGATTLILERFLVFFVFCLCLLALPLSLLAGGLFFAALRFLSVLPRVLFVFLWCVLLLVFKVALDGLR